MSRVTIVMCDLCKVETDKPRGTPPDGWFSYSKDNQPLDLCPACRVVLKKALNR